MINILATAAAIIFLAWIIDRAYNKGKKDNDTKSSSDDNN